jgi:hypothetical protein
VDAAVDAGLSPVVVLIGHDATAVPTALPAEVEVIENPAHADGQSASLRAGAAAVAATEAPPSWCCWPTSPESTGVSSPASPTPSVTAGDRWSVPVTGTVRTTRLASTGRRGRRWLASRGDSGAREPLEDLPVVEIDADTDCPPDVDVPENLPGN